MQLEDYTTPDFATEYAPRSDASQQVAAKKRGRPAPEPPVRRARFSAALASYAVPSAVVGCLLVVAIIVTRLPSMPTPLQITPAPTAVLQGALWVSTSTPMRPTATQSPTIAPSATQEPTPHATATDVMIEATPEPIISTAPPDPPTDVPTAWPTPRVATPTLIPSISPIMALIKQQIDSIATPTQGAIVVVPGSCVLCHTRPALTPQVQP